MQKKSYEIFSLVNLICISLYGVNFFKFSQDFLFFVVVLYDIVIIFNIFSFSISAHDLAASSNVQDAFVIAVEQQARERLERLSALKKIKPVDMTKLSTQVMFILF